jgi:hypothetical protein
VVSGRRAVAERQRAATVLSAGSQAGQRYPDSEEIEPPLVVALVPIRLFVIAVVVDRLRRRPVRVEVSPVPVRRRRRSPAPWRGSVTPGRVTPAPECITRTRAPVMATPVTRRTTRATPVTTRVMPVTRATPITRRTTRATPVTRRTTRVTTEFPVRTTWVGRTEIGSTASRRAIWPARWSNWPRSPTRGRPARRGIRHNWVEPGQGQPHAACEKSSRDGHLQLHPCSPFVRR